MKKGLVQMSERCFLVTKRVIGTADTPTSIGRHVTHAFPHFRKSPSVSPMSRQFYYPSEGNINGKVLVVVSYKRCAGLRISTKPSARRFRRQRWPTSRRSSHIFARSPSDRHLQPQRSRSCSRCQGRIRRTWSYHPART